MNKQKLLEWLTDEADQKAEAFYAFHDYVSLDEDLFELTSRRGTIEMPPKLPKNPGKLLEKLQDHFKSNVTLVSLVLSRLHPDRFMFYRVSKLEAEIFQGFAFFSEIVPVFDFQFDHVGRTNLANYLLLNEALQKFAADVWPSRKKRDLRLLYFLYEGLARLFLEKEEYHRYWLFASREEYFEAFDDDPQDTEWSGRKEMKPGDIAFFYRMAPVKAITDVVRVADHPRFDPWGAWDGFWVKLRKIGEIEPIPFKLMMNDPVLGSWGPVRAKFQGTVTVPVPHGVYNRLLRLRHSDLVEKLGLKPEPVGTSASSGTFASEEDFEDQVVQPLLKSWSFRFHRQYPCRFYMGSQIHTGRVDFLVEDRQGPVTLFEDKLRIVTDADRAKAVAQAKSYALMLGLPSFVVAAPEGLWVYSLSRNVEKLEKNVRLEDLGRKAGEEELRNLLLKLRDSHR